MVIDSNCGCHAIQCIFQSNIGKSTGGAVYIDSKSFLLIENSNFTNNNSSDGGAIYIELNSKLQIKMCSFWKNIAVQAGGAIGLRGHSTTVIESCSFMANHAASGGALDVDNMEHISIKRTMLLKNVASENGGAIAIPDRTNGTIDNITCVGNKAGFGGCLFINSAKLTLNNSDISENIAQDGAAITVQYSRIQVSSVRLPNM